MRFRGKPELSAFGNDFEPKITMCLKAQGEPRFPLSATLYEIIKVKN